MVEMANQVPALLSHDLQTVSQPAAYSFIQDTRKICSGLHATSGAGKTRSIFEYLSQNCGLYFVAKPTTNNYGSKDLEALLGAFGRNYTEETFATIPMGDSQEQDYQQRLQARKKQGASQTSERWRNTL